MIHDEHPFRPTDLGDPARRLPERIAAGVTVVTSGGPAERSGSTVASILVVEGAPARLVLSLAEGSDVLEVIRQKQQVRGACARRRRTGRCPTGSPSSLRARVGCSPGSSSRTATGVPSLLLPERGQGDLGEGERVGYQQLVVATLDEVALDDLDRPLIWFRGRYLGAP